MRTRTLALLLGLAFGLAGSTLTPDAARAGVPRSCIRPQADALACRHDTRLVTYRVMPAARVRALREQHRLYERATPRAARRLRGFTLEELRDGLDCPRC